MKIEIEENDLIHLLKYAHDSAVLDEIELGFPENAEKTRQRIHEIVFEINKAIGYAKWMYSEKHGIDRVRKPIEKDEAKCQS